MQVSIARSEPLSCRKVDYVPGAVVPLPESEEVMPIVFYFSPCTVFSKFCVIQNIFNLMKMITNMHISRVCGGRNLKGRAMYHWGPWAIYTIQRSEEVAKKGV